MHGRWKGGEKVPFYVPLPTQVEYEEGEEADDEVRGSTHTQSEGGGSKDECYFFPMTVERKVATSAKVVCGFIRLRNSCSFIKVLLSIAHLVTTHFPLPQALL